MIRILLLSIFVWQTAQALTGSTEAHKRSDTWAVTGFYRYSGSMYDDNGGTREYLFEGRNYQSGSTFYLNYKRKAYLWGMSVPFIYRRTFNSFLDTDAGGLGDLALDFLYSARFLGGGSLIIPTGKYTDGLGDGSWAVALRGNYDYAGLETYLDYYWYFKNPDRGSKGQQVDLAFLYRWLIVPVVTFSYCASDSDPYISIDDSPSFLVTLGASKYLRVSRGTEFIVEFSADVYGIDSGRWVGMEVILLRR